MAKKILHKRSLVANTIPTISELDLGELAVNAYEGRLYLKRLYLDPLGDPTEDIIQIGGRVPVENTLFVTESGNDDREGTSWEESFGSIEKAVQVATDRGESTLIEVGPGTYFTQGHIDVPDNCVIRCTHRTVVIKPVTGFEERNVFRLGSGCFLEGFLFEGFHVNDMDDPSEGFAVSFRPDAVITRAPYAHKIAVRSTPSWDYIAPPLDRANANPLVGKGGGVVLADGSACSPYSIYPNIMTWGATPVTQNGIGYCAKNGGLINAVNAVSIWAHKHFYALDGGQIVLSSCSTQFGDYSLVAKGTRNIVEPEEATVTLTPQSIAASEVITSKTTIINNMWNALVEGGYTLGWTALDEELTRRDAGTFLQCVAWVLETANEKPMLDFAKGLFDTKGQKVYDLSKEAAFIFSFEFMKTEIQALNIGLIAIDIVEGLVNSLISTLTNPTLRVESSTITAIGHTWTGVLAGVALTKIPPVRNQAKIQDSILEIDQGNVIASGQDDQGSAIFVGGLEIDADTGELSGPPFDSAVNRIATKTAISRSF